MDRRYLVIIIIIFICAINLYMISNFSDVVGSASVDIANYTVSLPEGFSLYENNNDNILISNPNKHMRVNIYGNINPKDKYINQTQEIKSNSKYILLSNGTDNINGNTIQCIFFRNIGDNNNCSMFYYTKFNHEFKIYMRGFNYDLQKDDSLKIAEQIVDTTRINYKK